MKAGFTRKCRRRFAAPRSYGPAVGYGVYRGEHLIGRLRRGYSGRVGEKIIFLNPRKKLRKFQDRVARFAFR